MTRQSETPIFELQDLVIDLYTSGNSVRAVDHISLSVKPGELLAIVGESGSGKTVLTLGPLGLLPEGVSVDIRGTVKCNGESMLDCNDRDLARLRGQNFGVVFQDPVSALNPMLKIGPQLMRQAMRLRGVDKSEGRRIALQLLKRTGIPDHENRYNCYPHEMSGGMLQRAMIALALVGKPRVLIADEPTTALDATVQAQILDLIKDIQKTEKIAVVLITHDIGVVASVADRVVVMYAGRIAETGTTEDVLTKPAHPYTQGLLASVPDLRSDRQGVATGIPGTPPDLSYLQPGCPFAIRCTRALGNCTRQRPVLSAVPGDLMGHMAACLLTHELMEGASDDR